MPNDDGVLKAVHYVCKKCGADTVVYDADVMMPARAYREPECKMSGTRACSKCNESGAAVLGLIEDAANTKISRVEMLQHLRKGNYVAICENCLRRMKPRTGSGIYVCAGCNAEFDSGFHPGGYTTDR
jgi:hypothetical protein